MNRIIYLIGFMGSGKSTAGKKLANHLGYSFTDLDAMIENKYRITIPTIFSRFDEAAFRKIEHETLKQSFSFDKHVISTGGGTPCFYNNMELINKNGISVYIKMHSKSLLDRLTKSKKKRPLIEQSPPDRMLHFIEEQLWKRDFFYNQANYTVKGENLEISELARLLNTQKPDQQKYDNE